MFSSTTPSSDDTETVTETARVVRSDRGLRVSGYLVRSSPDADRVYGSWYELLSDPAGELRRLTVRADAVSGERTLSLTRAPDGPWVANGSHSDPTLATSTDVMLAGSTLTLSLPAHRLALHRSEPGITTVAEVAVIDVPELTISTERVTYQTLIAYQGGVTEILVTSGNGENTVLLGADGLVSTSAERLPSLG